MYLPDRYEKLLKQIPLAAVAALVFMCAGCEGDQSKYAAPPPPEVTVTKPVKQDVIDYAYHTGTTQAVEAVDVRARVEGYLQEMRFTPSQYVNKDDILFIIDQKPLQAKVDEAMAQLAIQKANLKLAEATLTRKERAYKDRAVSEVEVIQARAEKAQARASIQAADADLETALINYGYTEVRAPISGRVSRNLVDVGNLVGSGEATILTNIRNNDYIHAYFNISENDLLKYMKADREDKDITDEGGKAIVYLRRASDEGYPFKGHHDFIDNRVDPQTGTLQVRAIFANPDKQLVPGLFVRIKVPIKKVPDALLVPDSSLGSDQAGRFLYVVNDKNEVEYRMVTLGARVGDLRVIKKGIKDGEKVIVKGLLRVRPGIKVNPVAAKASNPAQKAKGKGEAAAEAAAKAGGKGADAPEKKTGGDAKGSE